MENSKATEMFEPPAWDERYSGDGKVWGGAATWLARQGGRVTGADFSAAGLARAAAHAEEAGVGQRIEWWRVDAREFDAAGPTWELGTTPFPHPPHRGQPR